MPVGVSRLLIRTASCDQLQYRGRAFGGQCLEGSKASAEFRRQPGRNRFGCSKPHLSFLVLKSVDTEQELQT